MFRIKPDTIAKIRASKQFSFGGSVLCSHETIRGLLLDLEESRYSVDHCWRWVERALFDAKLGRDHCLNVLKNSPAAPWNNPEAVWDTKHLPYHEEIPDYGMKFRTVLDACRKAESRAEQLSRFLRNFRKRDKAHLEEDLPYVLEALDRLQAELAEIKSAATPKHSEEKPHD